MDAKETRDRVRARFETAITSSYDSSEVLAAFWVYRGALVRLECETHSSGHLDSVKTACELITNAEFRSFRDDSVDVDQERGVILKAAEQFQQAGLRDLGGLLRLFLAVLTDRMEESPEPSHCEFFVDELTCNSCGYVGPHKIWYFVNTTIRPEMEKLATSGALCEGPKCVMCDEPVAATPFFYCNPRREEFIAFWPFRDDAAAEEWSKRAFEYVEDLPSPFKGGKTRFCIFIGEPVAFYTDPSWGAVTVVQDRDEFVSTVSEPVMFCVEHLDMRDMEAYFEGKFAAQNEDWALAAKSFASAFLLNQGAVSRLEMLTGCLKNLGRHDQARQIDEEAARLRDRLIAETVILRIQRQSVHWSGDINKQLRVLQEGLPKEWGFSSLLDLVRGVSEGN